MNFIRKERMRLRRAYLKNEGRRIPQLLRTNEYLKATLPLLPWLVAASIDAGPPLQLALLVPGVLLTAFWLGFVFWTLLAVEAWSRDKYYMQVGRYLLPEEYHR